VNPLYDTAPVRIENIPLNSSSPNRDIFKVPGTSASLLLGSFSAQNQVWLISATCDTGPTLTTTGATASWKILETFRVAVIPTQDYMAFADLGIQGSLPVWLTSAFQQGQAVLLGTVTPCGGVLRPDSFDQVPSPYFPCYAQDWPYPMSSPESSLQDWTLRKSVYPVNSVAASLPPRFIERRFYNAGVSQVASSSSFFGDATTESNLQYQLDTTGAYTGIPNTSYVVLKHFPYNIVSITGTNTGVNYTGYATIVPHKPYLNFGMARGVPHIPLTITYGWMNVCEPYLDESGSQAQIVLNQPIENESIVVDTTPIQTLSCISKPILGIPHYPATLFFSLNSMGGIECTPRAFYDPGTVTSYSALGRIHPTYQPRNPTKVAVYLTTDTSTPPGTATVQVYGILEDGTDNYLSPETVTVSPSSSMDIRSGSGAGGGDWVGYFTLSTSSYRYIKYFAVTGTQGSDYCCLISGEGISGGRLLPVCSIQTLSDGTYLGYTLRDLRRDNLFQSMASTELIQGLQHTDGTLTVSCTAGESLHRGDLVYVKPSDGMVYRALAQNDLANVSQMQVLGVVYPSDIAQGSVGPILCRGVFGLDPSDPNYSVYGALSPGVLVLSKDSLGLPMNLPDLVAFEKNGFVPYTPVVRVIENFGAIAQPGGGGS
jgi:hypothetical protein